QRTVPHAANAADRAGPAHQRSRALSKERAMFITKKFLDRRTVLRGVGASVALPLLDAMVPAATALAQTAAAPRVRMGFVYFPHGAVMQHWSPTTTGTDFQMTRIL